jgi:2-C-methyl-D-erythritol 4-phosphate cytidylyltransferase
LKVVAVILAAGVGARSGCFRPKQLTKLGGRPVIAHSLDQFQSHPEVSEIAVVTNELCISEIESLINRDHFTKVKKILIGGSERHDSSLSAIRAYADEARMAELKILFHDAVRPLVNGKIISDVIEALNHYGAVDTAIDATDTMISVHASTNTIETIPDRRCLRHGQTPQGFHYSVIKDAYDRALLDAHFKTTDDCGVVLKYLPSQKIFVVPGDAINIKLTFPNDLLVLDKFLQLGRRTVAEDKALALSSLKEKRIVVFGGASGIGAAIAKLATAFGAQVLSGSRLQGVDISRSEDVRLFLLKAKERLVRIDAIINTAAVLTKRPLAHMSEEEVDESIGANFRGAINVARLSHGYLKETRGHLLFFSSSSYTYGRAFYSTYSASKAAIVNLTQALADEWNDDGIKVNCVNPERSRTPMRTKAFGLEPADTLLDPDEVAKKSLQILVSNTTGFIYDIVRSQNGSRS